MVTTSISLSVSPPSISSNFNPKPRYTLKPPNLSLFITSPLALPPHSIPLKTPQFWRISAVPQDFLLAEAELVENSDQIVSADGDGVSNIISVLLFIAFIGLSILTIGVIYIAVTDYLQKKEKERFEKEEASKKKSGKKRKVRARAGPRGFGQKIEEGDDDDVV